MFGYMRSSLPAAGLVVAAWLLTACSSGQMPSLAALGEPTPPPAPPTPPLAVVALRPFTGTASDYAPVLARELNERSKSRSIALVVDPSVKGDTTLVGYFTVKPARKAKGPAVIDYTWDVLEPTGGLRNRVTGNESVVLKSPKESVWSALPPAATARIADKAFEALGADLPKSNITTSSIEKIEMSTKKQ